MRAHDPAAIRRQHYAVDPQALESYETPDDRTKVVGDDPSATLVSSELDDGSGLHAPTIDVDHHMWIEPSSTPGHGHLYIDVPMTWDQYARLLQVLAEVGIVEPGYVSASIDRQATYLRLPHVRKPAVVDA